MLPWYLHRVLDALDRLMVEGIDYSCTSAAFENAREEGDHIYSFCKEVGIGYLSDAQITATGAYERLRQWYIANGTLEVKDLGDGKTKDIWNSQTTWGDHTVKGLNQILSRLLKLFPKSTRTRDSLGRNCLEGIGFLPPTNGGGDSGGGGQPPDSPNGNSVSQCNNSEAVLNVTEASLNQPNSSISKDSEANEANPAISRLKNLWTVLSEEERSQLLEELGLEKNSGANSSNQQQVLQNLDAASNGVSSGEVQTASDQVQNPPPSTPDSAQSMQGEGFNPSPTHHTPLHPITLVQPRQVNTSNPVQPSEPEVATAPTPPTPAEVAALILQCVSWVEILSLLDSTVAKVGKTRVGVFNSALKHISRESGNRQHLVRLLAEHIQQFPRDYWAHSWLPESSRKLRERALALVKDADQYVAGFARFPADFEQGNSGL